MTKTWSFLLVKCPRLAFQNFVRVKYSESQKKKIICGAEKKGKWFYKNVEWIRNWIPQLTSLCWFFHFLVNKEGGELVAHTPLDAMKPDQREHVQLIRKWISPKSYFRLLSNGRFFGLCNPALGTTLRCKELLIVVFYSCEVGGFSGPSHWTPMEIKWRRKGISKIEENVPRLI